MDAASAHAAWKSTSTKSRWFTKNRFFCLNSKGTALTRAAALHLEMVGRDDKRKSIRVNIGIPRRTPKQDWYCPVRISGLNDKERRIFGGDSWQALMLALRLVEATLRNEVRRGARLYSYGEKVSVNSLFAAGIGK